MPEFRVKTGDDFAWVVTRNGRVFSRHNKKARAVNAARKNTDANDTLIIHRRDGTVQEHVANPR